MLLLLAATSAFAGPARAKADTTVRKPAANPLDIKYSMYYRVLSSDKNQADEIFVDTTGEMRFNTHQQMKSGTWKTPAGFAYIEPADGDTLFYFVRKTSFFDIDPSDVLPECPDGDVLFFSIYRSDIKKEIKLKTNTCATDFNLLTGEQRKLFPMFIQFIQRLANRYRPRFPD